MAIINKNEKRAINDRQRDGLLQTLGGTSVGAGIGASLGYGRHNDKINEFKEVLRNTTNKNKALGEHIGDFAKIFRTNPKQVEEIFGTFTPYDKTKPVEYMKRMANTRDYNNFLNLKYYHKEGLNSIFDLRKTISYMKSRFPQKMLNGGVKGAVGGLLIGSLYTIANSLKKDVWI